jgi:hypothetical protein
MILSYSCVCPLLYTTIAILLLGAFAKFRKASSCPSVCMEQFGSDCTDFDKMWHLRNFRNFVQKIQVLLKSEKINGYLTSRRFHIYDDIYPNSS